MRSFIRSAIYLAIALCVLLAGWLGYQAWDIYTGVNGMVGVTAPRVTQEKHYVIPPIDTNHRLNVLVLGSDNDRKKEEAHPDTQSMIVVSINPRTKHVDMISIPRDFWVNIPGHGMGKIDNAFHLGSVTLARYTVEKLFHINIRNYAWVGLDGFIKVIDTFSGVTLNVNHPILDDYYPNDLSASDPYSYKRVFIPAGWQYMHGAQALEYVRSRHGDKIGDFGRSARQQQVLQQLRQHVNTLDILRNLRPLVDDLKGKIRTDFGLTELYQLAQLSKQIPPQNIRQIVLSAPTYSSYGTASNREFGLQSVVFPNWKKIRPLLRTIFTPLGPAPGTKSGKAAKGHPAVTVSKKRSTEHVPHARTVARAAHPTPAPGPTATPPSVGRWPGSVYYVKDGEIHRLDRALNDSAITRDATGPVRYSMLSVSPSHRWLAYIRFTEMASDLWVRNLRSGKSYKLTSDTDRHDIHNSLWAAWPSWSSDGKSILISWDAQKRTSNVEESEARPVDLAVWRLSTTGRPIAQLTTPAIGAGGDTDVATRPHSMQYVYVRWDYLQNNAPYAQLVLNDPATPGRSHYLTPRGGRPLNPAWDPAGKRLTFVRVQPNGVDQIVVAPVVHTAHGPVIGKRTVIDSGKVAQPSFTPDGRWVSYLKADGTGFSLYLERATGGTPAKVGAAPSAIDATTRPVWAP